MLAYPGPFQGEYMLRSKHEVLDRETDGMQDDIPKEVCLRENVVSIVRSIFKLAYFLLYQAQCQDFQHKV